MSGERSVLPSAARLNQAHAAGVRLRSRWLTTAAVALALAAALELGTLDIAGAGQRWAEALSMPADVGRFVDDSLQRWAGVLAVVLGLGVLGVLSGHTASGALGPVASGARTRLQMQPLRSFALPSLGATVVALVTTAWLLRGAVAGAARSIDASDTGLLELWAAWGRRGLLGLAAACLVAGVLELRMRARDRSRALRQTVAQVRADLRERGRGR